MPSFKTRHLSVKHSSKAQQLHIEDEGSIGWDNLHHSALSALSSKAAALSAAIALQVAEPQA